MMSTTACLSAGGSKPRSQLFLIAWRCWANAKELESSGHVVVTEGKVQWLLRDGCKVMEVLGLSAVGGFGCSVGST
jgi:hypothetical protein